MGRLTQEMLEDNLIDSNELMQVSKHCLTVQPKAELNCTDVVDSECLFLFQNLVDDYKVSFQAFVIWW